MSSSALKQIAPQMDTDDGDAVEVEPAAQSPADPIDEKSDTELELAELFGGGARMGHGFRRHGHGLYPRRRADRRKRQFDDD